MRPECAQDVELPVMNSPVGGKQLVKNNDDASAMYADKSTNELNDIQIGAF